MELKCYCTIKIMDNFSSEFAQPFIFKMPLGGPDMPGNVDLKWLGEELIKVKSLLMEMQNEYQEMLESEHYPLELLRVKLDVIESLSHYQVALVEQQRKRHGLIQTESDVQEMMSQLENFIKVFRDKNK